MFKPVYTITEAILNNPTTTASSGVTIENAPLIPKWEISIRQEALQSVRPDTLDLTEWLEYFTRGVMMQIEQVRQRILGLSLDIQKKKDFGQIALTERQMKIVETVNRRHKITAGEIAAMFGISRQAALKETGKLLDMNVLAPVGEGRGAHYVSK